MQNDSSALPSSSPASTSEHRSCPGCGNDNRAVAPSPWSRGTWAIKQCPACQFVYLENAPVYAELERKFAWEKTSAVVREERRRREPLLHLLSGLRKELAARIIELRGGGKVFGLINRYAKRGRVLDIGCGHGAVFDDLPTRYTPYGLEISRRLAETANTKALARGGYVVQGAAVVALAMFSENFFDAIVMRSYLEHEREPGAVLRKCRRILKPGGCVIVKVPNFGCLNRRLRGNRWCGYRFPDHVNYFTPHSLSKMVETCGFEIARFQFRDRLPTNDNMWMIIRKPQVSAARKAA